MSLDPARGTYTPTQNNGGATGLLNTALNAVDPSGIRLKVAGLFQGGASSMWNRMTKPGVNTPTAKSALNPIEGDWRVRISLPPTSPILQQNKLLSILSQTGRPEGLVFPYTPNITVTHNARYQEQALTHSNYKNYFYEGSDVAAITVAGEFTVQNHDEALYLLASIFFLRTCTKMFFGDATSNAGNPPPIVYLDGYGDFYFPHVTCVVTSFQHTMPADVDYVEVKYSESKGAYENNGSVSYASQQTARLPTTSTLSVTLQPIYSRQNIAKNMSLTEFSQGHLLKSRGGFL
jgi:hypothetical protein